MSWWNPSTWGSWGSSATGYDPLDTSPIANSGTNSSAISWDAANQNSYEISSKPSVFDRVDSETAQADTGFSWNNFGQGLSQSFNYFGDKLAETGSAIKSKLIDFTESDFLKSPGNFALQGLNESGQAIGTALDTATASTVAAWNKFDAAATNAKSFIDTYRPESEALAGIATFNAEAQSFFETTDQALTTSFDRIKTTTLESLATVDSAIDQWSDAAVRKFDYYGDVAKQTFNGVSQDVNQKAETFADWAVDGYYSANRQVEQWDQFAIDFQEAFIEGAWDDTLLAKDAFFRGSAKLGSTAGGLLEAGGEFYKEAAQTVQREAEQRGGNNGVYGGVLNLVERAGWGMEQSGAWLRNEGDQAAEYWLKTPDQPFTTRLWQNPGETVIRGGGELLPSMLLFGGMGSGAATATGATIGASNGILRGKEEGRDFDTRLIDGLLTGSLSAMASHYGGKLADKLTAKKAINGPIIESTTAAIEEAGNVVLDGWAQERIPDHFLSRILEAFLTAGASNTASRAGSTSSGATSND